MLLLLWQQIVSMVTRVSHASLITEQKEIEHFIIFHLKIFKNQCFLCS